MANAFNTAQLIGKEVLAQFKNNMVLAAHVNREAESVFRKEGDTVKLRKPVMFAAVQSQDITSAKEDIQENTCSVTLDTTQTVSFEIGQSELAHSIEALSERYIKPAVIEIVQKVENSLAGLYTNIYNFTGTPTTTPSSLTSVGNAGVILTENGLGQMENRNAFYDPEAALALANSLSSVHPDKIARTAIEEARVGRFAKFNIFECVSVPTHTNGVNTGTPLINNGTLSTTYAASKATWTMSLTTDGWTSDVTDIVKAGDVFTIAAVYAVNPKTRVSTGVLQNFVVTADADSGASTGPAVLTISPPIITSGAYQTCNAAAVDGAEITIKTGATTAQNKQNLLFHPKALGLAMAALEGPAGSATETLSEDGISITYSRDGDINTFKTIHRLDVLYGVKLTMPQWAVRHTG
ncbi:MAG: hypothetical protein GY938_18015 [Ketobacter sp.]|nr:hypothetical protein [Ketobacter sp.]